MVTTPDSGGGQPALFTLPLTLSRCAAQGITPDLLGHQLSVLFFTSAVATESLRPSQRPLVLASQLASTLCLLVVGPTALKVATDCLVSAPPWLMPDT